MKNRYENMKLIQEIEEARQAMIESIKSRGLADRQTLELSQQLDDLIFYAQKMKRFRY
ncbi:aspartyl-phosphate phosphatase Spo0E family protein [Cytobacillus oceanisediminis]|jgi:hypothetical protein|uniref:aspartyl-phosphate phosphatase Spo0E family protein n=1 Tax=Cytobacillus oceanisediminis TaxID=665099 RepID=UPI00215ABC30|nr:aspartyl-phosphate phosphatase Spo0E family protein [Cytobacillus oceanisediminis]